MCVLHPIYGHMMFEAYECACAIKCNRCMQIHPNSFIVLHGWSDLFGHLVDLMLDPGSFIWWLILEHLGTWFWLALVAGVYTLTCHGIMVCSSCGATSSNRIQYHISRFQSKNPEKVLRRYWDSLVTLPLPPLPCHVFVLVFSHSFRTSSFYAV